MSGHTRIVEHTCVMRVILELVYTSNPKSTKIYFWNDRCAVQVYSKFVFDLISRMDRRYNNCNERHHKELMNEIDGKGTTIKNEMVSREKSELLIPNSCIVRWCRCKGPYPFIHSAENGHVYLNISLASVWLVNNYNTHCPISHEVKTTRQLNFVC